jgi:hypothetical protein
MRSRLSATEDVLQLALEGREKARAAGMSLHLVSWLAIFSADSAEAFSRK